MNAIKRKILLNPGPATTTDTVKMAQVVPDICPREKEFTAVMEGLRQDLLKVVHTDPQEYAAVLFCGSGTLNMDVCLNSLLPQGKTILVINNGAYSCRAVDICRYYGLPCLDLQFPVDQLPDLTAVERTLQEHPEIALVYTTHHETGTGILNPVREIGAIAHRYGAISVVDTTSTFAMRPIHMEEEQMDFCMASAQKGLMAMAGLSFILGRRSRIEQSKDYPRRSYYCNLYLQYEQFETTGQMHFTPPVQTIYAAVQAMKEYIAEGEQAKWARHLRVAEAIHAGLEALGLREAIARELQSGLVVSVRYPDDSHWEFERIHDFCYQRGFTIYPGKIAGAQTFRLCALGAIDESDIREFFRVLEAALRECQVAIPAACSLAEGQTAGGQREER